MVAMSIPDGKLKLTYVQPQFIDRAWADGAHILSEAFKDNGGEITPDQLKMILSRGERMLFRMDDVERIVGWGVVRVDQYPNFRSLHVCELSARGSHFERFFDELKKVAEAFGCSRIRCSARPAQAQLFRIKCGFQPVYETLEVLI